MKQPMKKGSLCAQKCTRGGVGWGWWACRGGVDHVGVGWVNQGWGGSCRGWGGSCKGGGEVGPAGVG